MIIDKSNGDWCIFVETEYIDDVAYQLYLNYMYIMYGFSTTTGPQISFMRQKNNNISIPYKFYNEAKKLIRKEKLEKICTK